MPFVIENVYGIIIMVKKAGTASIISSQSICFAVDIIIAPISIRTGAVAIAGILANNGAKNTEKKNSTPVTIAVSPVLPPSAIPAAASTYTIIGVHPIVAANIVPREVA